MWSDSEDSWPYEYEELSEDEANFRRTLLERIGEIQATGSFATGNVLDSYPIPGICVDGGEPFAVPLSEEAAQNLAGKSDKAPFGKHSKKRRETLVDETVRKTLQISAERITFQNPQWDGFVNTLVQRVVQELGVPPAPHGCNVRAELYKHLLYEPGAIFKPDKGTEKSPGMFATLVLCLPSKHTGGEVCLQHGKNSLELSTAKTSAYGFYYLAWYTDVSHEIKPVQTGYRWALTYNLIIDYESPRLSASVLDSQVQSLVESLSSCEMLQDPPSFLVYPLDHQYTRRNLRLSSLKGLGYQYARCLADSCQRHGKFYLLLAQLDEYKSRTTEGGMTYMTRGKYLNHVCSLDGFELSPFQIDIAETSLLYSICYERDLDLRAGRGYLRNQRGTIEETYSDIVLVIVRADSLHAPLFDPSSPQDVDRVMRQLRAGINSNSIDDNTKTTLQRILLRLCRIILDQGYAAKAANDVYLGYVAVTAAFLEDWPLFEETRKKTFKAWDNDSWSALGGLIDLQDPPIEVDDIFKSLMKCGTFRGIYKGLTHFYKGFCENNIGRKDPAKEEYWKQWYSDRLIKLLDIRQNCMGEQDAATIKEIVMDLEIQYTPGQRKEIDEAVTSFVDSFTEVEVFVNALNVELLVELSNPQNVRKGFLLDLFGIISEFAISAFDFNLYYAYVKRLYHTKTDGLIRDFYNQALAYNEDLASNLLRQLSKHASNAEEDTAREVLFSLVKELLPSVNTGSLEVQTCIQSLVEAYITKTVGKEPLKPEDLARPQEVHECYGGCKVCPELNIFLKDPYTKAKTMTLTATDQRHIKLSFDCLETGKGRRGSEVYYTKTLKGWGKRHHKWESNVEAAQRKLQELPKDALKEALGDKYDILMALDPLKIDKGTAEAPDKAQPPSRPKRTQGKDANNTAPPRRSKRLARGEHNEG